MQLHNPYQERKVLSRLTVLSFFLLLGMICLLNQSCSKKKAPAVEAPTVIYADTTRVKLVHRVQASTGTLDIIHERTPKTVAKYEKSMAQYDSIHLTLP